MQNKSVLFFYLLPFFYVVILPRIRTSYKHYVQLAKVPERETDNHILTTCLHVVMCNPLVVHLTIKKNSSLVVIFKLSMHFKLHTYYVTM